jgi:hypothetical protein
VAAPLTPSPCGEVFVKGRVSIVVCKCCNVSTIDEWQ